MKTFIQPKSFCLSVKISNYMLIFFLFAGLNGFTQNLTTEFELAGYTLTDLGSITDLPAQYGGLTIRSGEPNTLYIGGNANNASGALYSVPLIRDVQTQQITGFGGPATLFVSTPNIDGGVYFAPNGTLLFTRYSMNELGQILPDNSYVSTPLTQYGVNSSVGSLAIVPAGYPGAGNLILSSYNSSVFYHIPNTIDGTGQYLLSTKAAEVDVSTTASGPEGIAYIPAGSAAFPNLSMLVSSYSRGVVVVYEVETNGLPKISTARDMVVGLTGAEGALIDPVTGDFLFSTFGGGNKVIRISGFENPSSVPDILVNDQVLFRLYPNPTDGLFSVEFNRAVKGGVLEVFNMDGKSILRKEISEHILIEPDLSNFPSGKYVVRVQADGISQTSKLHRQ